MALRNGVVGSRDLNSRLDFAAAAAAVALVVAAAAAAMAKTRETAHESRVALIETRAPRAPSGGVEARIAHETNE